VKTVASVLLKLFINTKCSAVRYVGNSHVKEYEL